MNSLIKWLVIALAVIVLLAILAAVLVKTLVDPQQYRALAIDAVQRTTGRTLTLDGEASLKLLPCCAVQVEKATLGNPAGFVADEPFMRLSSARLSIRLWPLLTRREVEIGTVQLEGVEVNLVGHADGHNNWTFAGPANEASTPAATGGSDLGGISVAGIHITGGTLNYRDEADGSHYRIEDLDLKTGPVSDAAPFDLETTFSGHDLKDNAGGKVHLKTRAMLNSEGDVTSVTLADVAADLDLRGVAGMEGLAGQLKSPSLLVRLADNTLVSAADLTADLKLVAADLPEAPLAVKAGLSGLHYDVDAGTGTLAALQAGVQVAGADLKVTLDRPGTFGGHTDLHGKLQFAEFSPRAVLAQLKQPVPVTADGNVLKRLSGTSRWFVSDTEAGLDDLALVLDDSRISGAVSRQLLAEGSKAIPRTRFDLGIDAINVDRYLEPEADQPPAVAGGAGSAAPATGKPTVIPVDALRGLNLDGRTRLGKLTIDGLQLTGVDVRSTASGGRLNLAPLSANLYGGSLDGEIRIDASGAKPRVTLEQTLRNIDVEPLLSAFADVRTISGRMALKLNAAGTGKTDDEIIRSLAGNMSFGLEDGIYKGMDVWYEIRKARALIRRIPPPARTGPAQTPINTLKMSGKLTDGILHTDQLTAEIPFLRVSGQASVDLPKKSLDSGLTALVFEKPVFGADESLEDLVNARIPLTIKGPLSDPKVRVDLQKMVQGALKESVREVIRDKLGDRLRDKLGLGSAEAPAANQAADQATDGSAGEPAAKPAPKKEDPVKKALDKLLGR